MSTPSEPVSVEITTTDADSVEITQTPPADFTFSLAGPQGPQGAAGPAGVGIPAGGTTGQVLKKVNGTDFNATWQDPSGGALANLTDVNMSTAPTNGQALVYDTASTKWKPGSVASGGGGSTGQTRQTTKLQRVTTGQSVASSTNTNVIWNAQSRNSFAVNPWSSTVNPDRLTAPVAGTYRVRGAINMDFAGAYFYQIKVVASTGEEHYFMHHSARTDWMSGMFDVDLPLPADGYVTIVVNQGTGATRTINPPGYLTWVEFELLPSVVNGGGGNSSISLLEYTDTAPPAGTPVGAVLFRKASNATFARGLTKSPVLALRLDEASGNFVSVGSDTSAFTPGAGITRSKAAILADGVSSVSGSGSAAIATLGSIPAGLGNVGTLITAVRFNSPTAKGVIATFGGTGTTGWSLDVGVGGAVGVTSGMNAATAGNSWLIGRHNIAWTGTGATFTNGTVYIAGVTKDSSNNFSLWINGTKVATFNGGINVPGSGSVNVGDDASPNYLSSSVDVDSVMWFNSQLSDTDMANLTNYGSNNGGRSIGWWDGTAIQPLV